MKATAPRCLAAREILARYSFRSFVGSPLAFVVAAVAMGGVELALLIEAARSCRCVTCDPVDEAELGAGDA